MTDRHDDADIERLLRGIDGPRRLPAGTRALVAGAIETAAEPLPPAVRDRVAGALAGDDLLGGIDRPRPLPPATRHRLADALAGARPGDEASAPEPPAAASAPGPADVGPTTASAPRARWMRMIGAAAALVLVGGVVAALARDAGGPGDVAAPGTTTAVAGAGGSDAGGAVPSTVAPVAGEPSTGSVGGATSTTLGATAGADGLSGGATTGGSPAGGSPEPVGQPPFTSGDAPGDTVAARGEAAVRLLGDGPARAAFDAYVARTNANGGAGGFTLVVRDDAGITVNLGPEPLIDPAGLVLEWFGATESGLRGAVFSAAGAEDRRGRVAVDVVYPEFAAGASAVVFREPSGVHGGAVADAIEARLRARGVTVLSVVWDPAAPVFPEAEAAFVSLDAGVTSWAEAARQRGYAPPRGTVALAPAADPALGLPDGVRVVAPYRLVAGPNETAALADAAGPPGVASVHGWVSAKLLALGVARAGTPEPAAVRDALLGIDAVDLGFAPYDTGPGANARTPDGVVLVAREGGFEVVGDFLDATG